MSFSRIQHFHWLAEAKWKCHPRALETIWKNDLPERFGPMTIKELRQSLRRASFVYPFLAIHLMAVVAISIEFKTGSQSSSTQYAGMLNISMLWEAGPFWMLVGAICLLIMPLTGVMLMSQELEEGNHELLQLTRLNRWGIVLGKFFTLWGLCVLTFLSLFPYVVVRYMTGGVEWWHEFACAGTIIGGSAMMTAAALGAAAYKRTPARIGILLLSLASTFAVSAIVLSGSGMASNGCGFHYYLTALCTVAYGVAQGLTLARSRLRLTVHAYEVKPSGLVLGWVACVPFLIGLITAISLGWGGFVALALATFVVIRIDVSIKAPKSMPPPPPNIPAA